MTAQGFPTTTAPLVEHRAGGTLGEALGTSDNALNLVRLGLALVVIVSHTGALTGLGGRPDRVVGLGGWAVDGFFAISGYLIVASRLRSSWSSYVIRRLARIYPGYWAQLLVVALVLAPAAAALGAGTWRPGAAAEYVGGNATLLEQLPLWPVPVAWSFEGITLPHEDAWNGATWSLMYELLAYGACLLLFSIPILRRHVVATAGIGAVAVIALDLVGHDLLDVTTSVYLRGAHLAGYFLLGALAYGLRDRIRPRPAMIAACAVIVVLLVLQPWGGKVAQVPLTLLVLGLGARLPWRLGAHRDISYGTYLYGYPAQQMMSLLDIERWGAAAHLVASALAAMALALVFWHLVERPAMRGARWVIGAARGRGAPRPST